MYLLQQEQYSIISQYGQNLNNPKYLDKNTNFNYNQKGNPKIKYNNPNLHKILSHKYHKNRQYKLFNSFHLVNLIHRTDNDYINNKKIINNV